ncbi:hypothetical protein MMC25_007502 [Agyrium rufum]|nr:hypothetical protein [Agyrium rufum]
MDLRDTDIGLVQDKLQRALRDAYNQFLLIDPKSRKVVLVLPSAMPHPLLAATLKCLFDSFQMAAITLLPAPTMAVVGSGLRSGIIVDIGWHETVVTPIYEYRELTQTRSTRAMRKMTYEMAKVLQGCSDKSIERDTSNRADGTSLKKEILEVDFDRAEEVTKRLGWCRLRSKSIRSGDKIASKLQDLGLGSDDTIHGGLKVSLPCVSLSSASSNVSFDDLGEPAEKTFFPSFHTRHEIDDDETPLALILFKSLLRLPPDIRAQCISRIIITGGGSSIPGLKTRLINELEALIYERGWDAVQGRAADERRRRLAEIKENRRTARNAFPLAQKIGEQSVGEPDETSEHVIPAALQPQIIDSIDQRFLKFGAEHDQSAVTGELRIAESLGSWTGASLLAGMRIRSIVEIERESFLQHGLAGAKRDPDISVMPGQQRQSFGPGLPRLGNDRMAWTLGAWA